MEWDTSSDANCDVEAVLSAHVEVVDGSIVVTVFDHGMQILKP